MTKINNFEKAKKIISWLMRPIGCSSKGKVSKGVFSERGHFCGKYTLDSKDWDQKLAKRTAEG